ncbi:type 1 glutamine amidotransferase [Chromohalobacter nigrandesensis]|uniref:type 1 glutamine amidotransferase n=1 Tax=Chromohalobacter nigrandesensis TaxID=119863 RepID=UPI001FF32FD2|nr:type 1 glutamine amidotransferase [Chromohalobacter nigrandesensis]MCK0745970.1 type 1 glutamine amidotransferase [Chromohalobacter nigrandesensis]
MTLSSAIVLLHSKEDTTGSLPAILDEHALDIDIRYVDDTLPDPGDDQLVIVMGSIESPYDHTLPWLSGELAWLKSLIERNHPVFGICFGSQVLARALGGETYRNHAPEIGWTPVETTDPALLPSGPWLNFHFDAFTAPPAARLLASTSMSHQAYIHRQQMGMQFHPEITPAMFDSWLAAWEQMASGRQFLADHPDIPGRLRQEIADNEVDNRNRFRQVFSAYLNRVSRAS